MVRTKANKFSGSDDALVKRLQKEILHLRDILNIRRKGGQGELAEQMMVLKEENSRLKEKQLELKDVEKLKHENKIIKLELQKLMRTGTHENFNNGQKFDIANSGEIFRMTGYTGNKEWDEDEVAKPLNNTQEENGFTNYNRTGMTQSDGSDQRVIENSNQRTNNIFSQNSQKENNFSPRETDKTAKEMFPSIHQNVPLSQVLQNKITPRKSQSNNSINFSNFQLGSAHLKENLSKKGRCPL